MLFYKCRLFVLCVLFSSTAFSQTHYTINGYIRDSLSGERLIRASIHLTRQHKIATLSNEYGFYVLTLSAGNDTLVVSSIGYQEKQIPVSVFADQQLTISLFPSSASLAAITITSTGRSNRISSPQMGVEHLGIKQVNQLPVLFGERDIVKAVQLLPGVK